MKSFVTPDGETGIKKRCTYHNAGNVVFGEFMIRGILDVEEGVSPSFKPRCSGLQLQIKHLTCTWRSNCSVHSKSTWLAFCTLWDKFSTIIFCLMLTINLCDNNHIIRTSFCVTCKIMSSWGTTYQHTRAKLMSYKPCAWPVPRCCAHHFTQQFFAKGGLGWPPVHILKHHPQVSDWHSAPSRISNSDCWSQNIINKFIFFYDTIKSLWNISR